MNERLILGTFDREAIWQPERGITEVAYTEGEWEGNSVPIIGRRYNNLGGQALKVICYMPNPRDIHERGKCIGMVGYHRPDAQPYCKQTGATFASSELFGIVASTLT